MLDSTSLSELASEQAPSPPRRLPPRAQPIRDALLLYLSEPRRVADIARHIQRPVPTTTGHLAAMSRLGLVKRVSYGVYASVRVRVDEQSGPLFRHPAVGIRRELSGLRRRLVGELDVPRPLPEILSRVQASEAEIREALERLWFSGEIAGDEHSGFVRIRRGTRRAPSRGPFARPGPIVSP